MLKLELELDQKIRPYNLRIVPQDEQDNDILNAFSRKYCYVVNPAITFSEEVKRGEYDAYTDAEYEEILAIYKRLSELFREDGCAASKPQPNGNLFELFVRLLDYYLSSGKSTPEAPSCEESPQALEEILLGALLVDVKISQMLRGSLIDEDFAEPDNVLIFHSIKESVVSEDELPDIREVAENYCRKTDCGKADAIEMLMGLIAVVPATSGISYYRDIIENRVIRNRKQKQ